MKAIFPSKLRLISGAVIVLCLSMTFSKAAHANFEIANFNGTGFGFFYGEPNTWNDTGATSSTATTFSLLPAVATEFGGAGFFYGAGGPNLTGEGSVELTGRRITGNLASQIRINFVGNGGSSSRTVNISLAGFSTTELTTVIVPLSGTGLTSIQQIQIQGTNFSASAQPLGFEFGNLRTLTAVVVPEPTTVTLLLGGGSLLGGLLLRRRKA